VYNQSAFWSHAALRGLGNKVGIETDPTRGTSRPERRSSRTRRTVATKGTMFRNRQDFVFSSFRGHRRHDAWQLQSSNLLRLGVPLLEGQAAEA